MCSGVFTELFECGVIRSAMLHIFMHIHLNGVLFGVWFYELNNYRLSLIVGCVLTSLEKQSQSFFRLRIFWSK